ncbi:VOC family protein [Nocardioides pantholopis]|uniref:VOC family protein n=1 Tax=Nocardioides pantholopis TaxID=2483798 RepID=UPI000FD7849E|nr:VOC family protein [Nocardioides pantholopis]
MDQPRIVALNHVGVSVADLDRARAFWVGGLGALEHGGWSWPVGTAPADESLATPGTAADVALLRTDTAFLELFAFSAPRPEPRSDRAPGVAGLAWGVPDVAAARARGIAAGGRPDPSAPAGLRCPDGTPVRLVAAPEGPTGLVGVTVRVPDPAAHVVRDVPGPVAHEVVGGADAPPARPVDLGVNHVCLDVAGIAAVRADLDGVRWHHDVTESSGGIAAVCYGTTADGVLVELLESRSPEAFLSRCRLARPGPA